MLTREIGLARYSIGKMTVRIEDLFFGCGLSVSRRCGGEVAVDIVLRFRLMDLMMEEILSLFMALVDIILYESREA